MLDDHYNLKVVMYYFLWIKIDFGDSKCLDELDESEKKEGENEGDNMLEVECENDT